MAYPVLFLGAFILSYFTVKFLRRFVDGAFDDDLDDYLYESFAGPATSISAGPGELWENNRLDPISTSSTESLSPDNSLKSVPENSILEEESAAMLLTEPSPTGTESTCTTSTEIVPIVMPPIEIASAETSPIDISKILNFESNCQPIFTKEEMDRMRKVNCKLKSKHLYISALNTDRPRNHRKIQRLPILYKIPTIYENLPYPITSASLMYCSAVTSLQKTEPPQALPVETDPDFNQTPPKKIEPSIITIAEINPLTLSSTEIKSRLISKKGKSHLKSNKKTSVRRQPCLIFPTDPVYANLMSIEEIEPDPAMEKKIKKYKTTCAFSPVAKKKKFRGVRKFIASFSCIRKTKDQ